KQMALQSLKQRGYRPQPLRRGYIPQSEGEISPRRIPPLKDRAMHAPYLLALDPGGEKTPGPNSHGVRPQPACAGGVRQCHTVLARANPRWVLEGDIKACFDRISHEWLLAHVPLDKAILRKWLKAGYMEKHVFFRTEEGTPQGGIISPVLANLALDGLER